jgi:hypothetical protein
MIPFVVDHEDGVAGFGFAESRWVLDLYEWAVRDPAVPEEQRSGSSACSSDWADGEASSNR